MSKSINSLLQLQILPDSRKGDLSKKDETNIHMWGADCKCDNMGKR